MTSSIVWPVTSLSKCAKQRLRLTLGGQPKRPHFPLPSSPKPYLLYESCYFVFCMQFLVRQKHHFISFPSRFHQHHHPHHRLEQPNALQETRRKFVSTLPRQDKVCTCLCLRLRRSLCIYVHAHILSLCVRVCLRVFVNEMCNPFACAAEAG